MGQRAPVPSEGLRRPVPPWAATWIEHWPAAVQALSLPQLGLELGRTELAALGRRNGVAPAAFGPEPLSIRDDAVLRSVATRLDRLLARLCAPGQAAQAFVRLGSRSAKDTPHALLGGLRVGDGAQAVAALTAGSRRIGFDLRAAWRAELAPWIWLRAWRPMSWHDEWRCFLSAGRLLGATQYVTAQPLPVTVLPAEIAARLQVKTAQLVAALGRTHALQRVVADWWVPAGEPAQLIELNPWGSPTEPGLFRWDDNDLDGTLRWCAAAGDRRQPLKHEEQATRVGA